MQLTIHEIIEEMRSDPAGIAEKFNVPLRTVYNWCSGSRKPPAYILEMMNYIILLERRNKENGNSPEGLGSGMEADKQGIKEACKTSQPKIS